MSKKKLYLPPCAACLATGFGGPLLAGSESKTFNPTWGDHMSPELIDEEGLWQ